jgi:hypothetical protein
MGEESDWGELSISMPKGKESNTFLGLLDRFIEQFPILQLHQVLFYFIN